MTTGTLRRDHEMDSRSMSLLDELRKRARDLIAADESPVETRWCETCKRPWILLWTAIFSPAT